MKSKQTVRLLNKMKKAGITPAEAHSFLGISQSTWSQYVNRSAGFPTPTRVKLEAYIAKASEPVLTGNQEASYGVSGSVGDLESKVGALEKAAIFQECHRMAIQDASRVPNQAETLRLEHPEIHITVRVVL